MPQAAAVSSFSSTSTYLVPVQKMLKGGAYKQCYYGLDQGTHTDLDKFDIWILVIHLCKFWSDKLAWTYGTIRQSIDKRWKRWEAAEITDGVAKGRSVENIARKYKHHSPHHDAVKSTTTMGFDAISSSNSALVPIIAGIFYFFRQ